MRVVALLALLVGCGSDEPTISAADLAGDLSVPDYTGPCNYDCTGACSPADTCTCEFLACPPGACFEAAHCFCIQPEGQWHCCYAGLGYEDVDGIRAGDPCCGSIEPKGCRCDQTRHLVCNDGGAIVDGGQSD
jgi:hypothetical protein